MSGLVRYVNAKVTDIIESSRYRGRIRLVDELESFGFDFLMGFNGIERPYEYKQWQEVPMSRIDVRCSLEGGDFFDECAKKLTLDYAGPLALNLLNDVLFQESPHIPGLRFPVRKGNIRAHYPDRYFSYERNYRIKSTDEIDDLFRKHRTPHGLYL